MRDLSKKCTLIFLKNQKITENKLCVILKSVIITICYKNFKKKICSHIWETFSENAKLWATFHRNCSVFEKLYLTLYKAYILVNIMLKNCR